MKNKMEIRFDARACNESLARTAVSAFVAPEDPTLEELTEIKTGVSEAVSNAVIHGYKDTGCGIVTLICILEEGGRVTITVKDEGVGIEDVEKARQPMFTTGKTEERSGMGFSVMESFMDKVKVISKLGEGTAVIMTKTLDEGHDL